MQKSMRETCCCMTKKYNDFQRIKVFSCFSGTLQIYSILSESAVEGPERKRQGTSALIYKTQRGWFKCVSLAKWLYFKQAWYTVYKVV